MVHCCILGCRSDSHHKGNTSNNERKCEKITFHRFPKDIGIRNYWIKATGRRNWQPTKQTRICSRHFETNCFKRFKKLTLLTHGSIPILSIPVDCDLENYMQYKIMGTVKRIKKKPNCIPTRFDCYTDRKYKTISGEPRSLFKKRESMSAIAAAEGTVKESIKPPTSRNSVSKMTKTNSEKCKDYYNRNKIEKKRQVAARVRAHRLRQKLIAQNGTPTDDLSRFIITSDTLVIRPGPQCQPAPCEINGTLPARKRIKQENSEITTPQELHNSGEDFNSAMKDLRSKPIESLEATNTLPQEEVTLECRACYQKFDYDAGLVDLFQSWNPPWNGMADTIAEDLSKLTSIEVSLSDPYSKYICLMCHQKLLDACNFVANVRLNDRVFREKAEEVSREETIWPKPIQVDKDVNSLVLNNSMVVEVKQEVLSEDEADVNGTDDMYKENDFNSMEIKVEPEEIVEQSAIQITVNGTITLDQFAQNSMVMNGDCISEDQKTEDVKVKQEPKSDDEESETVPDLSLECMLCTKNFNSVSGLKAHVVSQHSYKSVKRKTEGGSSPKKKNRHTCATCRSSFVTSTDLMVHETRHNAYACYVCSDKFDTFELLTKHRKKCKPAGSNTVLKPKTLEDVKRPYVSSPHLSEASELDVEMKVEPLDNSFSEDEVIN